MKLRDNKEAYAIIGCALRVHTTLGCGFLESIYGVETKALNQSVKRNLDRFPAGYIFQLDKEECSRSQSVTLNKGRVEA